MIPENNACNSRNNDPGVVSPFDGSSTPNLFRDVEVDYKHADVEVKSFYNILRGRYARYVKKKSFFIINLSKIASAIKTHQNK
jgi:glycosylphosphatidylinositol transamidase (GPIT) subunit GPI8